MVEETKEKLEEPGTGAFFQNLMQIPDNQKCANCNDKGSDQGSLNYGVFLCSECAGKMLELGDDCRPFGDESWDQAELIRFNYGGNKLFKDMMTFYQLDVISPDDRYKSKAAYYYRRRVMYIIYIYIYIVGSIWEGRAIYRRSTNTISRERNNA